MMKIIQTQRVITLLTSCLMILSAPVGAARTRQASKNNLQRFFFQWLFYCLWTASVMQPLCAWFELFYCVYANAMLKFCRRALGELAVRDFRANVWVNLFLVFNCVTPV